MNSPVRSSESEKDVPSHVGVLQRNLDGVRQEIAAAATDGEPRLVAVTKTVSAEVTALLHGLPGGPQDLGENRADAFQRKAEWFAAAGLRPRWHFIGHLQRNKVRRVLEHADVLHSIDSKRLAEAVTRIAAELNRSVGAFVEVNLTGEEEKHGLVPADIDQVIATLAASEHVELRGIMVMGPLTGRHGARSVDEVFADAAALAKSLSTTHSDAFTENRCELSMGMSGDLAPAIQHGTDYVRIGSALFRGLDDPATPPTSTSPSPSGASAPSDR